MPEELAPHIAAAGIKHGTGGATFCVPQSVVDRRLREAAGTAVENLKGSLIPAVALPDEFIYEVTYKDWKKAYQMSFYPGMERVDRFTNRLKTERLDGGCHSTQLRRLLEHVCTNIVSKFRIP